MKGGKKSSKAGIRAIKKEAKNSSEPLSVLIVWVRNNDTSKTPVRAGDYLYSLSLGSLTNNLVLVEETDPQMQTPHQPSLIAIVQN